MSTGIRSQIAPKGLHFSPSEFFISDKYATILTVVSFPKYIVPGYLSSLTNMAGIKIINDDIMSFILFFLSVLIMFRFK